MKKWTLSFLLSKANRSSRSNWVVNVFHISLKLCTQKKKTLGSKNNIPAIKIQISLELIFLPIL